MKRLSHRLVLLLVIVLAALPISAAFAEESVSVEGIYVSLNRGFTIGNVQIQLNAVKTVDGDNRESEVHFMYQSFGYSVDATFIVPIDADYLEVSDDLGWGGLDTLVWVTRTNNLTGEQDEVPLEIHLDLYATQRISSSPTRSADVRGTITLGGDSIDFSRPNDPANNELGYNFAS